MSEAEALLQKQIAQLKQENRDLRREQLKVSGRMAQLQDISKIVANEPDRVQLLQQLATVIAGLVKAERVLIGTRLNEMLVFEQMVERNQLQPLDLRIRAGEGVVGWVMEHRRPYLGPSGGYASTEANPHSMAVVPILNHQRHLLGVIECHKPGHHLPFTQKEVDLLQTIAFQVAPGLARALLFDQMERWTGSFENLLMFSASLNGKLESEVLIQRLVEHAAGFLGAEAGFAGLTTPTHLVSEGYWRQGQWQPFHRQWLPTEQAGTPGWVLINQCPYLANDYKNNNLADETLRDAFKVKNALCVPIMDAREEVLGFVELHNKTSGQESFSWSDAHFLEALASSTAISLYNAYLLDELETQKRQLQALTARNLTLLEDERQRIARELHDEAGQVLIGIKLELQILANKVFATAPELRSEFDHLRREINDSTAKIKEIARTLRPPILDEMGLEVALKRQISDFKKRSGIPVHFDSVNLLSRLPQPIETACYRIVQEALTNVIRHAQAEQVWITLISDEVDLHLHIQDDGCGFDPTAQKQTRLGLLGIQERVIMLGGSFTIETALQTGTRLKIVIPNLDEPDLKDD